MASARRRRLLRVLALVVVVWLAADALTHGTCAHDLIAFAQPGRSEVGGTSVRQGPDQGDPNHCACHWQYLPVAVPVLVEMHAIASVAPVPPRFCPPIPERPLERPPQRFLA